MLPTITIAELHKQLQAYIDRGLGDTPVVATDCRGRYPFHAYTELNQSGYTDALLLYVRPDAHFSQRDPLPLNWGPSRVAEWNAEADRVKGTCGAFYGMTGSKPAEIRQALSHLSARSPWRPSSARTTHANNEAPLLELPLPV
ncbi:hypothetical protein [Verminephrobacter eiseniae]|uniref:hypothetical protein n=1 Tax=Verminephrobacter eiseniae TaxID=364317 RepID=UPI002237EBDF|nr:hypothetical protein [Verminephrobacter eiseniae]MCW5230819.1 hypothetical protein [Verminephrobacter eiseniae]MCW5292552.1 hypothetical protein [Verminephrobacter eiseniae]MCW8187109.1 hypothetical protein [Verminephrobacter eiseniae]MCW8223526.1 hypothetical protein [Verminephrobacter eiseniae]MCW8233743.1 hypothetical protein [Verminephrobacter eiseniae]